MTDYLSKDFYKEMKAEVKTRVSLRRYEHIVNVAKTAKWLGETYGVDPKLCRLAGVLHDWDKGLTLEQEAEKARELGLDEVIDEMVIKDMPQLLHGPTAAVELGVRFPDMPTEVLHAIYVHTTACVDMSDLDMILYVADAIEPTRNYPELEELRAMVGNVTLFELYSTVYRLWTVGLVSDNRLLHPDTIDIYNQNVLKSCQ